MLFINLLHHFTYLNYEAIRGLKGFSRSKTHLMAD
jgi:hypothetical protein